jgi:protein-disulfide isomerase
MPDPKPLLLVAACVFAASCQAGDRTKRAGQPTARAAAGPARAGATDPLVVVVAFEDYQHPLAAKLAQAVDRVADRWPESVQVQYRHLAPAFHPQSKAAAMAAARADKRGRFRTARQALIEERLHWNWSDAALAETLASYRLPTALSGPEEARVAQDIQKAALLGVQADPSGLRGSVIVNGVRVDAREVATLYRTVVDELAETERLVRAGSTRAEALRARWDAHTGSAQTSSWILDDAPISEADSARAMTMLEGWGSQATRERFPVTLRADDAMKGSAQARVTIVDFTDFQCPFCGRVPPTLDALVALYPEEVRVVFKHLPLPFHAGAKPAAIAAECARAQAKFWPFHDALYNRMLEIGQAPDVHARASATALDLARELGLDEARFTACVADSKTAARIDEDRALGNRTGARGTPTLFFNGRRVAGALPLEAMRAIVHEELAAVSALEGGSAALRGDPLYQHLTSEAEVEAPLGEEKHGLDLSSAPRLGSADAPVQITVFSDFQCPYCAAIDGPLAQAQREMPQDIAITFKHFPLNFHERARPAAIASVCAAEQGKFWQLAEKLFANRGGLADDQIKGYAGEVGIEPEAFSSCLTSPQAAARVNADVAEGTRVGVDGTPAILVNGRDYTGTLGRDSESFKKLAAWVIQKAAPK